MLESLRSHPRAGNVRGRGMMAGIELQRAPGEDFDFTERAGHQVVLAARKRGVNLRAIGDLVLAVPPLTISIDEIELLGRVIRESMDEALLERWPPAGLNHPRSSPPLFPAPRESSMP